MKTNPSSDSGHGTNDDSECPVSSPLDQCRRYVRENPGMVLLGAVLLGAVAGAMCRKPEEKPCHRAWDWWDDTRHRVSDEVQRLRKSPACRQGQDFLSQVQETARNFKFW